MPEERGIESFRNHPWRISYRTATPKEDGTPVDILHDFYLPVLSRAVRYDRMAGYFRSTSLAAASQGFSAFVGRTGKMRLIVGADLDPEDVRAVLRGTQDRLASLLNARLGGREAWPEAVTRGVDLLAWMVAHGVLDVRVAFRVHRKTGEPLLADSVEDGYVHMKWAVFQDAEGNRIYITGSLNESRTALSVNAENIDVHCDWKGETERLRVEDAERDFEALWEDRNPAFRVLSLPEAVRERLIRLARDVSHPMEIDGTRAIRRAPEPPSVGERLRFALLRDGPKLPGGRVVGLETAPVTPWPHQAVVAQRLLASWPCSYLLCDEVGLGKTIEAGLVIRSLYLSGLAKRVLVCAPASLTRQWQREMASKFLLPFGRALGGPVPKHAYLLPREEERRASSLFEPPLVVLSTGLLTRGERRAELRAAQDFDLVLLDEAHYARRKNPTDGACSPAEYGKVYQTVERHLRPKTRCLLLATATPMQLDPVEAADLLRLCRRGGPFERDPGLMRAYYDTLRPLLEERPLDEGQWSFLRGAVASLEVQDPFHWAFFKETILDGRYRMALTRWLHDGTVPRGSDFRGLQRAIFAAAPLARVMLRHTRSLLEIYRDEGRLGANLAQREILPVPRIVFTNQERQAYKDLEDYCRELSRQIRLHGGAGRRRMMAFYLSFLRLRFASSLFAIRETLNRRLAKVEMTLRELQAVPLACGEEADLSDLLEDGEDDAEAVQAFLEGRTPQDLAWERGRLQAMLRGLDDLSGPSSKMTELLRFLDGRRIPGTGRLRPTVIFTRFYDTLTDLVDRLQRVAPHMRLATYSGRGARFFDPVLGRWIGAERDAVKHRFLRKEIDVLVCTDAAAEGLNLQAADALVNFDLPWNPTKVEQRIGRIDRIGQEHDRVCILNLCYPDSAEQIVYDRLLRRLVEANLVVGTQQLSLLPVTLDEFQQLAAREIRPEELERRARERAELARKRSESMEIPARELYEMYGRWMDFGSRKPSPVTLDDIWETLASSRYLQALGCRVDADAEKKLLWVRGVPGIPDGTALTASREVFDKGLGDADAVVHFASYGDPVFDALLEHMNAFELPETMQRLSARPQQWNVDVVAYAVMERTAQGPRPRLVTGFQDLRGLDLEETARWEEEAVQPLESELQAMAEEELRAAAEVARTQERSDREAWCQEMVNLLVLKFFLQNRGLAGRNQESFWRELAEIRQEAAEGDGFSVPVPRDAAERLRFSSFHRFQFPQVGSEAYLKVPRPMMEAALCAGERLGLRLARALKIPKNELTTDQVFSRVRRDLARELGRPF